MPENTIETAGHTVCSRRAFGRVLLGTAGAAGALSEIVPGRPAPYAFARGSSSPEPLATTAVIYYSDLLHPPGDPDDHVDLATLFSLPELDIRAIVLDLGEKQGSQPGSVPMSQMMKMTGRKVPFAVGLGQPLRYPEDKGLNQFRFYQSGVELLQKALEEAEGEVFVIATGSLRDIAAAYNRSPDLIRRKVIRVYINAGSASGGDLYWNPGLDPQAYPRIMRSDLPIYWCPCFGGRETLEDLAAGWLGMLQYQTFWKFSQGEIFGALPRPLQNFFLYALSRQVPLQVEPIAYLRREPQEELRKEQWRQVRNMWSTASLVHAAGRRLFRSGNSWAALHQPPAGFTRADVFDFSPAKIEIDADLNVRLELTAADRSFRVFRLLDLANYQEAMTSSLRRLLSEMTLRN
ncbi:MAG: nucleoside hydrolase [Acidobacteria bacterium]|nr:nucleoside hydrolase [Acidobacteriota bacterium]